MVIERETLIERQVDFFGYRIREMAGNGPSERSSAQRFPDAMALSPY